MPSAFIFNYPDTATEPSDLGKYFEKSYNDDGNSPSAQEIKNLNDLRSRMASLLLSQPNTKAVLQVLDEYIPQLIRILPYIEHNGLHNFVKYKWRSSLSASVRTSLSGSFEKPIVKSHSIYYEIIYVQMTYAFTLSNMAFKKVTSDTSEESLNLAINNLCQASGIFQSLSVSYASTWVVQDGPPETTCDSLCALADMALGDAQQLACIKAEKRNLSLGSLMKLKAGVVSKYDKCYKTIRANDEDFQDFSRHFKSHVSQGMNYTEATMLLMMAKAHAQDDEYGKAVAEVTSAHNMLLECKEAENSAIKVAARDLLAEASILHSNYTKINNSVSFQRVPNFETVRVEYLSNCKVIVDPKPVAFGVL